MKQPLKTITICSLSAIITIFAFSCRKLVGDLPPYDPVPVVNSLLVDGKTIDVHVSFAAITADYFLPVCENATVNLFVDDVFAETLEHAYDGLYISNIIAEAGKRYSCEVIIPEFDTLRAQTYIPEPARAYDLEFVEVAGYNEESRPYSAIKFSFDTDPDKRLFYHAVIKTYYSKWVGYDTVNHQPIYGDPTCQENYLYYTTEPVILNEGTDYPVFSNDIIDKHSYRMNLSHTGGSSSPIILEFNAASEDYYKYIKQAYLFKEYTYGKFSPSVGALPVHNLHSNVSGGFGIFAGVAVSVCDTLFPPNYNNWQY